MASKELTSVTIILLTKTYCQHWVWSEKSLQSSIGSTAKKKYETFLLIPISYKEPKVVEPNRRCSPFIQVIIKWISSG